MKLRSFAVRAFGAAAVATASLTGVATTASAAPAPAPLVHTTFNGPTLPVLGQNDFCNGLIDTAVETDPARPGVATVALTPRGMRGFGPGWAQNPLCRVTVNIAWNLGSLANQLVSVELLAGEFPGDTVRTEITPGSGVASIIVSASQSTKYGLKPQASLPVHSLVLVP